MWSWLVGNGDVTDVGGLLDELESGTMVVRRSVKPQGAGSNPASPSFFLSCVPNK